MLSMVVLGMTVKKEQSKEYVILRDKISFNIRKYRKIRHLTQEELAEEANISYDFMRRIESSAGQCGFSVYTLYKIAIALNVSVDELMDIKLKDNIEKVK
jgi:transcriptional regulator with XRE-family HTH domain